MQTEFINIPSHMIKPGDFLVINQGHAHPIKMVDHENDLLSYSLYEGTIETRNFSEVWHTDPTIPGFLPIEWRGWKPLQTRISVLRESRIEFFSLTKIEMSANEAEIVRMNLPYLPKPDFLPSPWTYLSDDAKSAIIYLAVRQMSEIDRSRLARHAIACMIDRHHGHIHECVANRIWAMFFPGSKVLSK